MEKINGYKIINILQIILALLLIASYVYAKDGRELILIEELRGFNLENPGSDLTKNIGRDDFRFIGLYGYARYFPGTDKEDESLIKKNGSLFIEGTSDYIESPGHGELIKKAERYADTYNKALLSYIKKHNVKPPEGYVPNEETAIAIAVSVWIPIYGRKKIENEKPYMANLIDGIWFVHGSLPKESLGGVAVAEILKENGKIIRVSHGK